MRITLDLPSDTPFFRLELQVRAADINYAGHVGNDRLLVYAQEARANWLWSLGYGELDIEGLGIILADAALIFKNEAFAGEQLSVALYRGADSKYGFDLYYEIARGNQCIARLKTAVLFYDYGQRCLAAPPVHLLKQLPSAPV